jgi:hypothetical protein
MTTQQSSHHSVTPTTQQGSPAPTGRDDVSARAIWSAIRRRFGPRRLIGFGVSLLLSALLPLIIYERVERVVGSQVTALLIVAGIPAAWTVGKLAVRRVLDPVGLLAVAGFGIGILMLSLTGSAFAFKIHGAVLAGAIGVLCLATLAIRRPLFGLLMPKSVSWPGMARRTTANWVTGIWGVVLVTDAAVITVLAATLPTRTFLAVDGPVGWSFLALGVGGVIWRRRHLPAVRSSGEETGS